MVFRYILSLVFIFQLANSFAQENLVQPSVVVVPFTKSGEDALSLYESKFEYRAIINEINNAITTRGFLPQDLQEIISRIKENSILNDLNNVNIDPVKRIIDNTTADILIKAEIFIYSENQLNSVQVTLKAVDKGSGKTLFASPLLSSPNFKTTDFAYLAKRVLSEGDAIGAFCNGMSLAFQNIAKNGRSIQIIFETNDNSTFSLDDEDSSYNNLGDLLVDLVKKRAYNGYYKIKTQTSKQLYFEEVRVPLFKDGSNYDINLFARDFRKDYGDLFLKIKPGLRPKIATPIISNGVIRFFLP
jgi:hypothetical protein